MAFNRTYLESTTNKHIVPRLADAVFKGCPFAYYLRENHTIKLAGGRNIVLPLVLKEGNFDWWDRLDNATTDVIEPENAAQFDWKWARTMIYIPEVDIWKNGGEDGIINIMESRKQHGQLTIIENLSDGLTGTNASASKQLDGLQNLFGASGTAYGDLTDTDFASPASWLTTNPTLLTANTLTPGELRRFRGAVTQGASKPNLALCNQSVYDCIWRMAQDDQRFGTASSADIGFDVVTFEGMKIIADSHVAGTGYGTADNALYMLNMDHVQFFVHQDVAFVSRVFEPMPMQNVWSAGIYLGCNLTTDNRRMHVYNAVINPSL